MNSFIIILLIVLLPCVSHAATIKFKWIANDPVDRVAEYRIYQDGIKAVSVTSSITTATIINVTPGAHTYYVTAVNEGGESPPSNTVTTPPIPSPVTGVALSITIEVTVK